MGFGIAFVHHSAWQLCDVLEFLLLRENEIYKVADCPLGPLYREDAIAAADLPVLAMGLLAKKRHRTMPQLHIPRPRNEIPSQNRRRPHSWTISSGYQKASQDNLRRISSRSLKNYRLADLKSTVRCRYYIRWLECAMSGRRCAIIEH